MGALATQGQIELFEKVLFIDDPLGASAVHLGAGGMGMLFVAFFADPQFVGDDFAGLFYGGSASFLGNQILGMIVYSAWAGALSYAMFKGLSVAGWLRCDEAEELEGMDKSHHGGYAYPPDDKHMDHTQYPSGSSDGGTDDGKNVPLDNELET